MAALRRRPTPTTSTCRHWPPTRWSTSPRGRCGTPEPVNPPPARGWWRPSGSSTTRWPPRQAASTPACCISTCTPWRCRRAPQDALPAADLLRGLVPDAGHLQHMPSHIDVLCGDYRNSVASNLAAVQADRAFVDREGPLNFYSLYRAHDLHFVVYSAMFEGSSRSRCSAADELAGQLTPELLAIESPPMADWLEAFVPLRIHVLVRFGRWDELIAQPLPDDPTLYCTTTATIHYGRGVAHAAKGQLTQARAEREAFTAAYAAHPGHPVPVQQHRPRHPGRRRRRCSTVKSPIGKADSTRRSRICGGPSHSTTPCPTTNRGAGCNRPGTPTARCCSSRATSRRPPQVYAADLGLDPTLSRSVPAPRQRVEPARLPRMPAAAGPRRRGRDHRPAAGAGARPRRRADPGVVRLPARGGRRCCGS